MVINITATLPSINNFLLFFFITIGSFHYEFPQSTTRLLYLRVRLQCPPGIYIYLSNHLPTLAIIILCVHIYSELLFGYHNLSVSYSNSRNINQTPFRVSNYNSVYFPSATFLIYRRHKSRALRHVFPPAGLVCFVAGVLKQVVRLQHLHPRCTEHNQNEKKIVVIILDVNTNR